MAEAETRTRFHCRLFDRRYGGEIGSERIMAKNRTEARKELAKMWKRDVPFDARNTGFVPFRDVRIEWNEE